MMTKRAYEEPKCEVSAFECEDILTTSGGKDNWDGEEV